MTRYFDVCNGDADGLCAVVQWRLHLPLPAQLVTGLKRDITLLTQVPAESGDEVLVCDLSMRRNRQALEGLLARGARVRYFDHHEPGEILAHPDLQAHIDTRSDVCTSLLVDHYLGGRFRAWALVGAYGDNLTAVADRLAAAMGLAAPERQRLQLLGEAINYNAYGDGLEDVHMAPARLYELLVRYANPLDLLAHEPIGHELACLRERDLARAAAVTPQWEYAGARAYVLPDAPWSRRVIGTLINRLAVSEPGYAHAILKPTADKNWLVSVRAPLQTPQGAVALCRAFGGDGRAGAAGIDHLAPQDVDRFITALAQTRWGGDERHLAIAPVHS
jgi:hypothetical protein